MERVKLERRTSVSSTPLNWALGWLELTFPSFDLFLQPTKSHLVSCRHLPRPGHPTYLPHRPPSLSLHYFVRRRAMQVDPNLLPFVLLPRQLRLGRPSPNQYHHLQMFHRYLLYLSRHPDPPRRSPLKLLQQKERGRSPPRSRTRRRLVPELFPPLEEVGL